MSADESLSPAQFPYGSAIHRGLSIAMIPSRAARFHSAETPDEKSRIIVGN
jgi:hypothetical protein